MFLNFQNPCQSYWSDKYKWMSKQWMMNEWMNEIEFTHGSWMPKFVFQFFKWRFLSSPPNPVCGWWGACCRKSGHAKTGWKKLVTIKPGVGDKNLTHLGIEALHWLENKWELSGARSFLVRRAWKAFRLLFPWGGAGMAHLLVAAMELNKWSLSLQQGWEVKLSTHHWELDTSKSCIYPSKNWIHKNPRACGVKQLGPASRYH